METTVGGDLIGPGLELLLAGMGTVFVLLGLLVATCAALSRAVRGWHATPTTEADGDDELVAAVTAAIRHHHSRVAGGLRAAGES
ncbi:MAG: OadG family protein [Gammaproteobacteria bacterium]|nr:OadG family protein [Gammaproteobacteria bacterium]